MTPSPDDPERGISGEGSHNASSSSSLSSQSTLDEWMSADGGATASGDALHSSPDGDPEIAREIAEANAERIDTLTETLDWLTKLVAERTASPSEVSADDAGETADRGFQ